MEPQLVSFISVAAYFLWQLEDDKPISERRFFKRYLTFWNLYNILADFFFLIGLFMKLLEYYIEDKVRCYRNTVCLMCSFYIICILT